MPLTRFRFITFLVILFSCFVFLVNYASAATVSDALQLYKYNRDATKVGKNSESWGLGWLTSTGYSLSAIATGELSDSFLAGQSSYSIGGLLGLQTNLVASLYTPQASGVQYLATLKDSFLGKPAYAQQGQGFAGLQPILPIWRGFRNITYILSSIFFITIGLMVMLRVKISPQAVVTVQNAIPGLVTTLILITFSYAIAGLLIDLMQLLQSLVMALLFDVSGVGFGSNLLPGVKNYTFEKLSTGDISTIADLTTRAIPMAPIILLSALFGAIIGGITGIAGGPVTVITNAAIGIPAAIIFVLLIIVIMVVIWMFKFYFGCLKVYVTVIFKIIIAPLELAMGAFPNSKMGFNTWIWDLIANLSVFPISMIFMVVGNLIIDQAKKGLWAPSIISGGSIPQITFSALALGNIVAVGIGLAVVSLMAKLPEMIPQFIFSIKPSPWAMAIGEGLKPENASLVGGMYKDTREAFGKARGQAILTTGSGILNRFGVGERSPQIRELDEAVPPR